MRRWALLLALLAAPVPAQNAQTLADIRQELSVVFIELQRLKQELNTTGGVSTGAGGGTVLDRVNAIEGRVQQLTARSEELEFRIDRIVEDGTNRIGDLEFRLCELEPGCDIAALGDTPTLGGVDVAPEAPVAPAPDNSGLTVAENADFQAAQDALNRGEYVDAATRFATFVQDYPSGPLTVDALLFQGQAHEQLGEMRAAARAYLSAFSSEPTGPQAPDAMLRLGTSLGALGQQSEACLMLQQLEVRFPESTAAQESGAAQGTLGC